MELFEKIGDAASKTYKFTAEKTSKIAKETKIKMQINEHKSNIKEIYIEIGEMIYEKFVKDEDIDMEEIKERCEKIQGQTDEIIICKNEILKLKEKKQCKNCYEEIEINANYCPNCGFEQEKQQTEDSYQGEETNIEVEKEEEQEEKEDIEE